MNAPLAELDSLVFRPGGVALNNVFTDWQRVRIALAGTQGPRTLRIDSSLAAAVMGDGFTDLAGVTLLGPGTLTVPFGATFSLPDALMDGLALVSTSTAVACAASTGGTITIGNLCSIRCTSGGGVVIAQTLVALQIELRGSILNGAGKALSIANNIDVNCYDGAVVQANVATGAGLLNMTSYSCGTDLSIAQAGLFGAGLNNVCGTGVVVFSANGSWTCPNGIARVTVIGRPGAGGGRGGGGGGAGFNGVAGGGGGGGRGSGSGGSAASQSTPIGGVNVVAGSVYTVTVGAGGLGGVAGTGGIAPPGLSGGAGGVGTAGGLTSLFLGATPIVIFGQVVVLGAVVGGGSAGVSNGGATGTVGAGGAAGTGGTAGAAYNASLTGVPGVSGNSGGGGGPGVAGSIGVSGGATLAVSFSADTVGTIQAATPGAAGGAQNGGVSGGGGGSGGGGNSAGGDEKPFFGLPAASGGRGGNGAAGGAGNALGAGNVGATGNAGTAGVGGRGGGGGSGGGGGGSGLTSGLGGPGGAGGAGSPGYLAIVW